MKDINKVINSDSLLYLKKIESESIDLILTDPPYNTTDCKWDKKINYSEYWKEWKRIIKPTGTIIITAQMPFLVKISEPGLDWYRHKFIWEKDKCGNFLAAKAGPLKYTEDILIFQKQGYYKPHNCTGKKPKGIYKPIMRSGTGKPKKTNSERLGLSINSINNRKKRSPLISNPETDGKKRFPADIIYFSVPYKNRIHPTQKPQLLFEYLIKTYTNENMIVLDCFSGSGTTATAALKTKRNYICIEKNYDMFKKSKERIEKYKNYLKSLLFY